MNNIAILFNASNLGGAERSIIFQSQKISHKNEITYFIPYFSEDDKKNNEIYHFLKKTDQEIKIRFFHYPLHLYENSKIKIKKNFLETIISLFEIILELRRLHLFDYNIIWSNGNKISFVSYLYLYLANYRQKFIWHIRDYLFNQGPYFYLWKMVKIKRGFNLLFIGNSHSVCSSIKEIFFKEEIINLYNPVGNLSSNIIKKRKKFLGIMSMFAPWKGIHQVVWACSVYEQRLRKLGILGLKIYGGDIYKTVGEHSEYGPQLSNLVNKYCSDFIQLCGIVPPEEALLSISTLIHSSLSPEPFGRVICEAFNAKVPVISTALGGAGELVVDNYTGLHFFPYDYKGLIKKIELIETNPRLREKVVAGGHEKVLAIEAQIETTLKKIFL